MIEECSEREAEAVLREYWGHESFRPGQWESISSLLEGDDVLSILPTGGGKSLCYQIPGLLADGLTLVVSPLVALMQDQVAGLKARGIPAAFINSTLTRYEIEQRWTDAEFGHYRFLYVAPERFDTERFQARADRLNVSVLAVDEAHCVSEWGHHFRPAYRTIPDARERLGDPPTIAVTATATPEVRRDIIEGLALRGPVQVIQGFDRPSLVWSVFRTENKPAKVKNVIENVSGSGLIYAATRRATEDWSNRLRDDGISASAYHAGLSVEERERVQEEWIAGKCRVVAATNAFGMGIDKADVRFVIHADLPGSLEAYYQEAGRAGRDGDRAYAVLLFRSGDETTQQALIDQSHPDAAAVRKVYDAACSLAQIPVGGEPDGPVAVDAEDVARVTDLPIGQVDVAIDLIERQGTWQTMPLRRNHVLLRFSQTVEQLRRYADEQQNPALARFVRALLRAVHADAFSGWWEIDLRLLERRTQLERSRLLNGLRFLRQREVLDWHAPETAVQVWFAEPRTRHLPVDGQAVRRARRRAEERLDVMTRYARSTTCRRRFLLSYFGQEHQGACGSCDVCMGRHRPTVITADDEPLLRHILTQVAEKVPRSQWFNERPVPSYRIDELVDWLVQEGYLGVDDPFEERFVLTEKAHQFLEQWKPRRDSASPSH